MATTQTLYAVNNTDNHVTLKNGYVRIERNSYKPVTQDEITHPDYVYAESRGWLSFTDKLPEAKAASEKLLNVVSVASKPEGLTIEQLREQQAKAQAKDVATATPIGRPAEPEVEVEAKTEEVKEEVKVEAKPKAKAQAKTEETK